MSSVPLGSSRRSAPGLRARVRAATTGLLFAAVVAGAGAVPALAVTLPGNVSTPAPGSLPFRVPLPTSIPTSIPTAIPTVLPTGTVPSGPGTTVPNPDSTTSTGTGLPGSPATGPTDTTAGAGTATSPTAFQPSADEQRALPSEPERLAYEAQQLDVFAQIASIDTGQLAKLHLDGGGGNGTFGWPVAVNGRPPITQRFGCSDLAGEPYKADCPSKRWHTGLDFAYPSGTPVYAAADGVAKLVPSGSGYGNYILLAHGAGYSTLYGHLTAFAVPDGTVVTRGELIGFVGSTGYSTGPHLHFEVRYEHDYIDPCAELSC